MGEIIRLSDRRKQESNGYKNLSALFQICDSVESCNVYLEMTETLFEKGSISESELYTLRRIGRQKRLELANSPQEAQKAEAPGAYTYTPEMGQQKPEGCQMEARRAYYGNHVFIDTTLELKGRGIQFLKTYSPNDLTRSGQYKSGWNSYQVTNRAYDLLKSQYAIAWESCLD